MSELVLVTYATRSGSTADVADAVGRSLTKSGLTVEVLPVKQVKDVDRYAAVVLGSAVRMGRVMPESLAFVKKHQTGLQAKPVAYFVVCLTMKQDTPENRKTANGFLNPWRNLVPAKSEGLFAGKVEYAKLGWLPKWVMTKMVKEPEGDHRDWKAIQAWAEQLPAAMGIKL